MRTVRLGVAYLTNNTANKPLGKSQDQAGALHLCASVSESRRPSSCLVGGERGGAAGVIISWVLVAETRLENHCSALRPHWLVIPDSLDIIRVGRDLQDQPSEICAR